MSPLGASGSLTMKHLSQAHLANLHLGLCPFRRWYYKMRNYFL